MTPRRFLDLVITISIGVAIVVGLLAGIRALVGTTGIGLPAIDVVFVPGDWFTPTRVTLIDETTVQVEGVTSPLSWSSEQREFGVSGGTLVLWEGTGESYPASDGGTLAVRHAFSSRGGLSRPVGWRVVRIERRDGGTTVEAAYVLMDLTKMVWLKRTGPLEWRRYAIEQ
ncbi:hypothetical protein MX659_01065 [Coriobacteriia bacterium Es71-Z0120]|uniref:hypothetical protein n=1 Tax=Parvivirga hydrogeniphila TaxID=2939460 RepID=UPI002260F06C|nr:hypothetical protein [Parvivirga hydrogeniphila]MCL4078203.1 hypothetical protein [Parvivirga hydrogeniphila]